MATISEGTFVGLHVDLIRDPYEHRSLQQLYAWFPQDTTGMFALRGRVRQVKNPNQVVVEWEGGEPVTMFVSDLRIVQEPPVSTRYSKGLFDV